MPCFSILFILRKGNNSMKKYLLLLFMILVILSPSAIIAQTTITGTIVDQQTKEPVPGVVVLVKGTNNNTTSNDFGKFSISSENTITVLSFSRIGYVSKNVMVSANTKTLYILLTSSPVQLTGVEIVGNSQILNSQSVGKLTAHDLDRASGLSLENSINSVPGVFMQSRTPWGGARITIRGYYPSTSGNSPNSNGLGYQVFLNNIPVTDATGSTVLDDIDFSSLGSVEVIKGPSSNLYGSFIGGTVNLITSRPAPDQTSFEQQTIGGSYGLFRTNTAFLSSGMHSDIAVNYGHQTYNSFRPHSASWKDFVRINGDFDAGSNQSFSTYFSYVRSFEELAGEIDSADFYNRLAVSNPLYLANDSHIKIESYRIGITDHYRFNENINNQTTLFGSGRTSAQPFAHGFTDVNQFNYGLRTAFYITVQTGNVGINGTLGGMFQKSNLTTNGVFIVPAPPFPQRPTDQENYALNYYLFTEWNFTIPDQIIITAGASLNKNEFAIRNMLNNNQVYNGSGYVVNSFTTVLTPRISVLKELNSNISVYASVGMGYTPPLLSDAVASDGTINTSLKPEKAVQYEIGTKGNLVDGKLAYQFSVFDLENTDKLIRETLNSVTFTTNAGKQRNKGLELSASYMAIDDNNAAVSLLRPWISYSYSDFKYVDFKSDNNNNSGTVDFSGNSVARVPRNIFSAGVDIESNTGFYINGSYQFVDKVPVTFDNSTYVDSYNLLNAKIGYRKLLNSHWNLELAAGGDNLLNSTYYSFLFTGPNITGLKQAKDGGTGDGFIIPAPYKASLYGNVTLSYIL
jgi:iron complex outermembrane receptor protein